MIRVDVIVAAAERERKRGEVMIDLVESMILIPFFFPLIGCTKFLVYFFEERVFIQTRTFFVFSFIVELIN